MKAIHELLHGRTRVRQRYALMPLEGFPTSRLPHWRGAEARVLVAPALGANFAEYQVDLQPGGGTSQQPGDNIQTFAYVLGGEVNVAVGPQRATLSEGGYLLAPATSAFSVDAPRQASLLVLRKRY